MHLSVSLVFSIFNPQINIVGNTGRFGKYGEQKRADRLRQARNRPSGPKAAGGRPNPDVLPHRKRQTRRTRIAVRPAEVPDAAFIRSLSRKTFHQYGPYEELLPDWFLSGIGLVFVAVIGKKNAGYAMLERIFGKAVSPRTSELLAVAVEPWARNQGIGDRLMEEIIQKADQLLVERLVLHTAVENLAGQAFFRKHGFVVDGTEREFYPKGQDALIMHRNME